MGSSLYLFVFLCLTSGLSVQGQSGTCCPKCQRCSSYWTRVGGSCFYFHHGKRTWAEAEKACHGLNGNLASIDDQKQYDFLKDMIFRLTNRDAKVWIGGHDSAAEGQWQWADGAKFSASLWGSAQPDNSNGNEHCLELIVRGDLNDAECNMKKPFVCRRPLL